MIKWTKSNGSEIETNEEEATIAYAESLGWKREGQRSEPEKENTDSNPQKRRGRPKKDS